MSVTAIVCIAVAGLLAGGVNTVAGGGTLVTFPVLVAVGLSPVSATIASAVGLTPGYAGGAWAYRRELKDQRRRVLSLLGVSAAGGLAGALLLLTTPASTFEFVVPYLIIASCALLAAQPWLADRLGQGRLARSTSAIGVTVQAAVAAAATYGAYFGGGLGVLLLAVLGILVPDDLQRLNGLKAALSLVIVSTGVAVFVISGRTPLLPVAVLAIASYIGGLVGGRLARKVPERTLRIGVCGAGLAVAATMLVAG